jgi:hypothetical protein
MFVSVMLPSLEKNGLLRSFKKKYLLRYCGYRFDSVDPMIWFDPNFYFASKEPQLNIQAYNK